MTHRFYPAIADTLQAAVTTFVGDPPDNVPVPYAFVWGPLPIGEAGTAGGCGEDIDEVVSVTVVAASPANVFALAATVQAALKGFVPVVEGWRVFPLRVVGSGPVMTARGAVNEPANRFPSWLVLECQLKATKS